jgi:hypothetical protein
MAVSIIEPLGVEVNKSRLRYALFPTSYPICWESQQSNTRFLVLVVGCLVRLGCLNPERHHKHVGCGNRHILLADAVLPGCGSATTCLPSHCNPFLFADSYIPFHPRRRFGTMGVGAQAVRHCVVPIFDFLDVALYLPSVIDIVAILMLHAFLNSTLARFPFSTAAHHAWPQATTSSTFDHRGRASHEACCCCRCMPTRMSWWEPGSWASMCSTPMTVHSVAET